MTHTYGPHRTEDAPTHILTGAGSKEHPTPIAPALVAQRAQINRHAHSKQT